MNNKMNSTSGAISNSCIVISAPWLSNYPVYFDLETNELIYNKLKVIKNYFIKKFTTDLIKLLTIIELNFRNLVFITYNIAYQIKSC